MTHEASTFEFTEDDYSRILLKDSLFNETTTGKHDVLSKELLKLQERETRLYLHAVTLSDYVRVKRIPRGLRINKGPILGKDNEAFCDRWSEILNKCSFDLMTLTIQELSSNLAVLRSEIAEVKLKLSKEVTDPDKLKRLMEVCDNKKTELTMEITAVKRNKFERDTMDYEKGHVYQWKNPVHREHWGSNSENRRRHVRSNRNYQRATSDHEYESESSVQSQSSASEQLFLDRGQRDAILRSKKTQRGRNAGGGRKAPITRDPYLTRGMPNSQK
nr:uncharacterized protein LOC129438772 isoform X2 [Misgurnus anguillicaudatus]